MTTMKLEVKQISQGFKGLFSKGPLEKGDVVLELSRDNTSNVPTRTSIEVSPGVHIEDALATFINHSCTPNCTVVEYSIICIEPIESGDEITFDYNETETCLACPFVCNCCGKEIRGRYV